MTDRAGKRHSEGRERIARIQEALSSNDLDAVLCTLPSYVLMLTGYWPIIGTAMAVATKEGEVAILAPEDELEFAEHSWAHRLRTFSPGSLNKITTAAIAATDPLRQLLRDLKVHCARIGYEYGAASEPATYAGMNLYGIAVVDLLRAAAPSAPLAPANQVLAQLNCGKTAAEVDRIRLSCKIAAKAFKDGKAELAAGKSETEVATAYRRGFSVYGMAEKDVLRADGMAWCMSGPNSAKAGAAFAHSRNRKIKNNELVLVHANSYADGYWTDITRTQVSGELDKKQRSIFKALTESRAAAFDAIKPGVHASFVDQAAREVIRKHGFEREFQHSLGHGVGFAAISANARPRIHPASDEILETGMTFNIEPSIYIEGYGGARHCDVVAVTSNGMELLTNFQNEML
jgi:Xaa-Pro aminopeptidase